MVDNATHTKHHKVKRLRCRTQVREFVTQGQRFSTNEERIRASNREVPYSRLTRPKRMERVAFCRLKDDETTVSARFEMEFNVLQNIGDLAQLVRAIDFRFNRSMVQIHQSPS